MEIGAMGEKRRERQRMDNVCCLRSPDLPPWMICHRLCVHRRLYVVTLVSSLSVNCRCMRMFLLSAGACSYTTNWISYVQSHGHCLYRGSYKTLVQAFVSSRLDYCNAILHGLQEKLMRRPQSVQNAAARMITSARRRDHSHRYCDSSTGYQYDSVSTSRLLSWYSSVWPAMQAPAYLADDCELAMSVLADTAQPIWRRASSVVRTTISATDRCIAAAGPRLWSIRYHST